jgi:hypothetical protein
MLCVGRDSSVGIATRYGLDGPVIESRWRARFSAPVQTGPPAHTASCRMGTGSFPGLKWPGRGVNHPPPSSAEVAKSRALPLLPLWAFVACYRVTYTFTFTLTCKLCAKFYVYVSRLESTGALISL